MKKDFSVKTWLYPISCDPVDHVYRRLTAPLAKAFKIGLEGR